jgi:hypothetical protein
VCEACAGLGVRAHVVRSPAGAAKRADGNVSIMK